MTAATTSTTDSVIRVHSSPARHTVPPRTHSSRSTQRADTAVSQLARNLETFQEATGETLQRMLDHQKHFIKLIADMDEKIRLLVERVRRLEDLVGGNIVREGYN